MDIKQVCESIGADGVVLHYSRGTLHADEHYAIWLQFGHLGFSGRGETAEAAVFNGIADAKKYGLVPVSGGIP